MLLPMIRFYAMMVCLCIAVLPTAHAESAASTPPAIILAKVLDPAIDPANYLVSEKFDGVRAIWDGKILRFRSGNVVNAPAWFIAKLPIQPLDGELWLARSKFEILSGYVRKTAPVDEEWRQIRYLIFELPGAAGSFEERSRRIQEIAKQTDWPQLLAIEQFRVADHAALHRKLDAVIKSGGEGLMLHRADASYVTGRSDVLLKLKPLDDTEAIVVGHVPGKGKYSGMLGALRVEAPDGKRFNIGTGFSDEVRKNPPAIGTNVTYTYRGLTSNGVPRFASYLRVREKF